MNKDNLTQFLLKKVIKFVKLEKMREKMVEKYINNLKRIDSKEQI